MWTDIWTFGAIFFAGLFMPGMLTLIQTKPLVPILTAYLGLVLLWPLSIPLGYYAWKHQQTAQKKP